MDKICQDVFHTFIIVCISFAVGGVAGYIAGTDAVGGDTVPETVQLYVTPTTYAYTDDLDIMVWAYQNVTCGNTCYIDTDHNCTIVCGDSCYIDCYNDCVIYCGNGCEIAHGMNCSITHGKDCDIWCAYPNLVIQ